ncbi:MAG: hybrid sensor histidine kinase/response regulator [Anaerolineae bacterium]|nr:hybrid sensor histidine kinase/response regulator [Anaerolineae bacterium]
MTSLNVLMLEDSPDDVLLIKRELTRAGFRPNLVVVQTEADYLAALTHDIDIVLADYNLPGYDAARALNAARELKVGVPFILISGTTSEEVAVEIMKRGATDYLLKDRLSRLGVAVQNALEERQVRMIAESERATAQRLLAQLDRERALNEQRNRLVQFATHELKNPLTSMMSSAEMLLKREDLPPESRRRHAEVVYEGVGRLLNMINDMLTLGRLDEGLIDVTLVRVELDVITAAIVDEFRIAHPHQPILCEILPADYHIAADIKLVRQIIDNLLGNAIRYSPNRQPIKVELTREGDDLVLRVADQGIGVPPEDLPHLFEPYHRAANVGGIAGTGLGLAIVKQAVVLHDGRISVHSVPGQGTLFTVALPAIFRR